HRQPHAQIPAQRVPARGVIARPGLRVTLNPWWSRARHRVDALTRSMRSLGLCRGTRHQERVQGPRAADRQRAPEAMRHTRVVPDFVLVVVVPARVDTVIEHLPAQVLLPPANTLRMRKVDMRALAVPELADARLAGRIVPDECFACGDLAVRW